jgi:hypothetical protein
MDTRAQRMAVSTGVSRTDDAVEDGLAVLGLADLQVGIEVRGGDVVALGVDHVQLGSVALDLPAEDEGGAGVEAGVGAAFLGVLLLLLRLSSPT